jgi:glycosyltransferase involved in cell wall biosynthesis
MSGAQSQGRQSTVVIVINALHSGGAERCLIEVARALRHDFRVEVVALLGGGPAQEELRASGVNVTLLEAGNLFSQLKALWILARFLRRTRPAVVITFLYLADFVAGTLARLLVPGVRVFWNVHNNVLRRDQTGALTYYGSRVNAWLSRSVPSEIIYCSNNARSQHEALGYAAGRARVIENSAGSIPFRFSADKRRAFRGGRLANDEFLFLFAGRYDPIKRVDIFIDACGLLEHRVPLGCRFMLAGRGMDASNVELARLLSASGVKFDAVGFVADQQLLYSSADCLVVTSESEGSPLIVYEAIATRLPVIILGTIGTEHLGGESVQRLETRSVDDLVTAMAARLADGIPSPEWRAADMTPGSVHPLATYYREIATHGHERVSRA